jgi:polar amino acid transport system substrate-binding protein
MSLLTPTPSKNLRRGFVAALIASAIALAGCSAPDDTASSSGSGSASGGSSPSASIGTVPKNAEAAAALPASVKSSGVVNVASGVSFPPMEYFASDNKTVLGFDADLGAALGQATGVKFKFTNVDFDGIIGGLAAGRYDVGITAMTDKKARQEKVDFVDYLKSGAAIMVVKGNPQKITGQDSLCGMKVGSEKGATGDLTSDTITKTCVAQGKKPVDKQVFPTQANAVQALQAGRVDAVIALDVTLAYNVSQSNGAFELVGKPFDMVPMGIAIAKGNTQMLKSTQLALKAVQDSGVYDQILAKYGLTNNALSGAPINTGK